MGRRTGTETAVRILVAFLGRRTWSQAELARAAGVESRTVRKHLEELEAAGVPLEREEEHPQVYWSMPRRTGSGRNQAGNATGLGVWLARAQ